MKVTICVSYLLSSCRNWTNYTLNCNLNINCLLLAQSWFETEKQTAETEGVASDDSPQETLQPSVPTGSDEDSRCQVCHDAFEQFYNEEKEEWHLRPAVNYEEKNYHPLCLEDYKVGSLVDTYPLILLTTVISFNKNWEKNAFFCLY